jgi:hypothetical protein
MPVCRRSTTRNARRADERGHLVALAAIDQRPDLDAGPGSPSDPQVGHPLRQLAAEVARDPLMHEEPVRRRAGLAPVAHLGQHRAVDRRVEVRVVEDEERCVAAQLHGDAQEP